MTEAADTPVASYIEAAAPPGSIDYYVLLFADPQLRGALASALALGKVILNITAQAAEPDILRLKLAWWHDEIAATRRAAARHPLTADLSVRAPTLTWLAAAERLVGSVAATIASGPPDTLAAVLRRAHGMAERQALLSALGEHEDDQVLACARAAGVGIGLTEVLRDRRLPPAAFRSRHEDATLDFSAADLARVADDHFEAMGPVTGPRPGIETLRLQAAMHRALLARLQHSDFNASRAEVHPLRLLWQAWREARRLRA